MTDETKTDLAAQFEELRRTEKPAALNRIDEELRRQSPPADVHATETPIFHSPLALSLSY